MRYPKRLIEVDLPIRRISEFARREKGAKQGHISTLHIWWARRPLGACRAVICAALWPDPADPLCPEEFRRAATGAVRRFAKSVMSSKRLADTCSPETFKRWNLIAGQDDVCDASESSQQIKIREELLDFIADFANWDNASEPAYLELSRELTRVAHESLGGMPGTSPVVVDPFAGGGAIPLEALRVGSEAFASDLNPVPVLLNKVVQEYVPRFGSALQQQILDSANRIREEVKRQLDGLYVAPSAHTTPFAYLWARTVVCEGPGCGYRYPLMRSLWIRQKARGGVAYKLQPNEQTREVDADILHDVPSGTNCAGTSKLGSATCPVCSYTTAVERVRDQLSEREGGTADAKLLAVVEASAKGRDYRRPTPDELRRVDEALSEYKALRKQIDRGMSVIPDEKLNHLRGFFNVVLYGMTDWGHLPNPRQAILMVHLAEAIRDEHLRLVQDRPEMAEAVATCLALMAGKVAQNNSSCCRWVSKNEGMADMFGRQAIPMVWDFVETYPFSGSRGDYGRYAETFASVVGSLSEVFTQPGTVQQASATRHPLADDVVDAFVTDPPYYDAIPYADLSDYFYVWLRRMLLDVHPSLFEQSLSPKDEEAVMLSHRAAMYRNKDRAFFEKTMAEAMLEGRRITKPSGIGIVVFANKSTSGWEAMLGALVDAGWTITASWPIDTEMANRLRAQNSAVLASSVHLVCRPRENPDGSVQADSIGDWRDVLHQLPLRIQEWMPRLAREGVVGADAIFACLGPALEIFSRYSRVEKASGEQVTLREYLEEVWAVVSREALNMIFEGADATGFEEDARITAMWLWTLSTEANGNGSGTGINGSLAEQEDSYDDDGESGTAKQAGGYTLEFDAARKIAQGLGVHLDRLGSVVQTKGDTATLLSVAERAGHLFGRDDLAPAKQRKKRNDQLRLDGILEIEEESDVSIGLLAAKSGETTLDRVHQSMLLFSAGRSDALQRFLVDDGIGRDQRLWKLAQALSALYPKESDEKRWVDGVLARKKGLGF